MRDHKINPQCFYCDRQALYLLEGFAEDGENEGYCYGYICEFHKAEFENWDIDTECYLHGYAYYESIIPLEGPIMDDTLLNLRIGKLFVQIRDRNRWTQISLSKWHTWRERPFIHAYNLFGLKWPLTIRIAGLFVTIQSQTTIIRIVRPIFLRWPPIKIY